MNRTTWAMCCAQVWVALLGCASTGTVPTKREVAGSGVGPVVERETAPTQGSPEAERLAVGARQSLRTGDWEQAEAQAVAALRADSRHAGALLVMAEVRARGGQPEEALNMAKTAFEASSRSGAPSIEAADWVVRTLVRAGRASEAVDWANSAVSAHPNLYSLKVLRLSAMSRANRPSDVLREARALLLEDETHVGVMRALAHAYSQAGKPAHAAYVLERALEVSPEDPVTLLALSGLRVQEGRTRNAIELLERCLSHAPYFAEARNALGAVFHMMGDSEGAKAHLEQAVASAPGFAEAWLNLASAHRASGDFATAERLYRKALMLDANLVAARYNLAVMYLESPVEGWDAQDRLQRSIEEWQAYLPFARDADEKAEVARAVDEARKLIEVEQQRRQQDLKSGATPGEG